MAVTTKTLTAVRKHRGIKFHVYYDAATNTWSLDTMMVVLLSDIRDELRDLRRALRPQLPEPTRRKPRKPRRRR